MTKAKMIERTIRIARQHLTNGNADAYDRVMQGAVRGAMTTRERDAFTAAIKEDGRA